MSMVIEDDIKEQTSVMTKSDSGNLGQGLLDESRPFSLRTASKLAYVKPSDEEYECLLSLLKERLDSGNNETILEIGCGENEPPGLNADDFEASSHTLTCMATSLEADCIQLCQKQHPDGLVAQFLIRKRADVRDFAEVRVAVVGNVDAGKSTLLGVLTHGDLDNGRGLARQRLFRHKHELETGRTSSVSNDILGFDSQGRVVNKPEHGHLDWVKICEEASKVITFIDLAGHEKYLKTTVFGMTGHAPDFCMLMVGANAGIIGMTKEHLGLALALSVPVFVVVTKVDMCPANVLSDNVKLLHRLLKSPGCRKLPIMLQSTEQVIETAAKFTSERICPIFLVSNVTGENLDLLKLFLNLITPYHADYDKSQPVEFLIDDTFMVPGVGTVISGTCLKGEIKLNDTLLLGPDSVGHFQPIVIKSIHRKRMPVTHVCGGQTASFALKKIKRSQLRKGMVLLSPALQPKASWEFEGEVLVLHHPTLISVRYQAMAHIGSIRQTASILSMSSDQLRTGDKALVRFRFIKNPEYVRVGSRMVFREGKTKAVGTVTQVFPQVAGGPLHQRAGKRSAGASGKSKSAAKRPQQRRADDAAVQRTGAPSDAADTVGGSLSSAATVGTVHQRPAAVS